jgi:parallel beta-helix repeat protein
MNVNWGIKKMDKRYSILIVSITILVLCFVGTTSATNWSVDGSGEADFTGIQEAINKASAGDTIIVHSGVYYENVVVDKSVTLKGIGQPVVNASGKGNVIRLGADGIRLEGFNVTKGSRDGGAGIAIGSSNNTITDNNISNNSIGISLWHSSNNNITGNNVSNNNEEGIFLFFSSNNTITGNNVSNNERGISLLYSSNNNITGNNVSNNEGGISLLYSSNNNITGNKFVNDDLAIYDSYQNTVEDNIVNGKPLVYLEDLSDCKVEDAGQVILVNCSKITVENLDISNRSVGIELWETENSIISNNTASNNSIGIFLCSSSNNNTITGNNVRNNGGGIALYSSSNNKIYFNNFINNTDNVDSSKSTKYKSYLGNYWDGYEGTDAEGDGIGDTHYSIYSEKDESDEYPLMKPFENY